MFSYRTLSAFTIGVVAVTVLVIYIVSSLQSVDPIAGSKEIPAEMKVNLPYADSLQSGPGCSLSGSETFSAGETEVWGWELTDFIASSHMIAKAVITNTTDFRFGTPDGAPPPLPPSGSGADDEEDEVYNNNVYRIAILDVTTEYSGTGVTGYVVAYPGGTHPDCPDYEYRVQPQVMTGEKGDIGLLFAVEPTLEGYANPTPMFQTMIDTRDALNLNPSVNYELASVGNWSLYVGADSVSGWLGSIPVAALEADVKAATSP